MSSGAPPGGAGGDDRRQRLRDQMKAFYGDPNASSKRAASQTAAAIASNPNVPPELDIDSEYFNVGRYTTDLLKRESLKGLVETDTELLRQVRRLDGELQELVYRNYARFISATDTIREMKENVVEMDTKLQTLSLNVNTIDGISGQITRQLQVHRSRIEETITANRMLKKVQFLASLPVTMRRLIDKEEYGISVKYWVAGDGFLSKHSSIASLTQIQHSCCELAGELYKAIEKRMCTYPLDDPDAMDRIRSDVQDLRTLRATSLFEAAHMTDQGPFEEAVLQTLMTSVMASFQANVATTQRSLKAAFDVPEDLLEMDVAKRGAALAQMNLREPLAQLKNACAMLAVNTERVHALLDTPESNNSSASRSSVHDAIDASTRVARAVEPVLAFILSLVTAALTHFALAHFDALAADGAAMVRDAAGCAAALRAATAQLAKLLREIVSSMKTLAEIYLTPINVDGNGVTSPRGRRKSLEGAAQRYAGIVHDAAKRVLERCRDALLAKAVEAPVPEVLRRDEKQPSLLALGGLSALPTASETHLRRLSFALSRFTYASLAQCAALSIRDSVMGADAVPVALLADTVQGFESVARQLQHRGIVLLGQVEVGAVYGAAFSASSSAVFSSSASAAVKITLAQQSTNGSMIPVELQRLLPEWLVVYDALHQLPQVSVPAVASSNREGPGSPSTTVSSTRRRDNGFTTSDHRLGVSSSSGYLNAGRPGGAGTGGSSNGGYSDHRGHSLATGASAPACAGGRSGGSKLVVAYARQTTAALQMSVQNIFSNAETVLRTAPVGNASTSNVMACVVRYLLQGLIDLVREEPVYNEVTFQRLQLNATYLLYALLAPPKGTAPRQWRKEWSEADTRQVQQLIDELCMSAYDRYEAKVPLSAAMLEEAVESALRGGRATAVTINAPEVDPSSAAAAVVAPGMDSNSFSGSMNPGDAAAAAGLKDMAAVLALRPMSTVSFPCDTASAAGNNTTAAMSNDIPSALRRDGDPLHDMAGASSGSSSNSSSAAASPVRPSASARAQVPSAASTTTAAATAAPSVPSSVMNASRPMAVSTAPSSAPAAARVVPMQARQQMERTGRVDEDEELPM